MKRPRTENQVEIYVTEELVNGLVFREQMVFDWNTLAPQIGYDFFLHKDTTRHRLSLQKSTEKYPLDTDDEKVHVSLDIHVSRPIQRDLWHRIYCYVVNSLLIAEPGIFFDTNELHQPYLRFTTIQVHSMTIRSLLEKIPGLKCTSVLTGEWIRTTLTLDSF